MAAYSCDFSYARPAPAAIKAAGYVGVWRYLSGGTAGKDITFAEFESYLKAGLGIGLVWETSAQAALGGAAQGTADGKAAVAQAASIGFPHGAPLLCNVGDFAATPAQISAIQAYYDAFAAEASAYQYGGYATGYIIDELVALGCKGIWWQNAENDNGSLGSALSINASVYQDVVETLPEIAGSPRSDYDQDVNVGVINWATIDPPPVPDPLIPPTPSSGGYVFAPLTFTTVFDGNQQKFFVDATGQMHHKWCDSKTSVWSADQPLGGGWMPNCQLSLSMYKTTYQVWGTLAGGNATAQVYWNGTHWITEDV